MNKSPKTPVMVLQERMVKKGKCPCYELVHSIMGTHEPSFIMKVQADGITAVGSGRSKKEAKHLAARNALEILAQEGMHIDDIPELNRSPSPKPVSPATVQMNSVGALQDMCEMNSLPFAEYKEISDVGPAHNRVFTTQCTLGSLSVNASSSTKKSAKQQAAQKMIDRIVTALPDLQKTLSPPEEGQERVDLLTKTYEMLTPFKKSKQNYQTKISDHCYAISNIVEEKRLTHSDLWKAFDGSVEKIRQILIKLDIGCKIEDFSNEHGKVSLVYRFDTDPEFAFIGCGETKEMAQNRALEQMVDFLKLMC